VNPWWLDLLRQTQMVRIHWDNLWLAYCGISRLKALRIYAGAVLKAVEMKFRNQERQNMTTICVQSLVAALLCFSHSASTMDPRSDMPLSRARVQL
jgi:hypothetical protein